MTHVYFTPKPYALNMGSEAMKSPMTNLVTEPTEFPGGTLLIAMVSIICAALAVVELSQLHLGACFSLL